MSYLLDANVLIAAKRLHYGFDFCPAFWDWLVQQNGCGYGIPLGARGKRVTGDADWRPSSAAGLNQTLPLLKLHASLHLQVDHKDPPGLHLEKLPCTKLEETPKFTIIPPESNKPYDQGIFKQLWKRASIAIGRASSRVRIGYSLPPTDLHATASFRTSVKSQGPRSLVIVNPDQEARRRRREVLLRGLSMETRVPSFNTLAEFLAPPTSVWRPPASPASRQSPPRRPGSSAAEVDGDMPDVLESGETSDRDSADRQEPYVARGPSEP